MAVFKCKMCGGDLIVEPGVKVAECEYCGTKQTLPNLDNEKKANLYDRANHFRRNNDFDKAMGIYEQILNEDQSDAEAYWSLVLCRYGIEYVEDPATHKRVPTVNRAQYTSIFADEDYKSALEQADPVQKGVYEAEAKAIDEIQKGILEISSKEEPFDVFICYKETAANGRRTQDSVLANDLYHQLTQEGFKVFFSRITLEDKLGTAYEPYIFAALNSAKVMVVIGTKPEYFNAVWVKNEWSRYLALIRSGAKKTLIPAYRDMDPYDLPEEFSHLQAQDMSKLGFMQDLIRGIKKISAADAPKAQKTVVVQSAGNTNLTAQLKRGQMALEDRDWEAADDFFDKALDIDAESAEAFLGKALAANRCSNLDAFIARRLSRGADREETLTACEKNTGIVNEAVKKYQIPEYNEESDIRKLFAFDERTYSSLTSAWKERIAEEEEYWSTDKQLSRAVRFAKGDTASQLKSAKEKILTGLKERLAASEQADPESAKVVAETYAREMAAASKRAEDTYTTAVASRQNDYEAACKKQENADSVEAYSIAANMFLAKGLKDFQDCAERAGQCEESIRLIQEKEAAEAKAAREKLEADVKAAAKRKKRNILITLLCAAVVAAGALLIVFVIAPAVYYRNAEQMLIEGKERLALRAFIKAGAEEKARELWPSIAQRDSIAASIDHTVGLKVDGTVMAEGRNMWEKCDLGDWKDIVAVAACEDCTVGLKENGTVIEVGLNYRGQRNVSGWTDIVSVAVGKDHTVGLKVDGSVLAVGANWKEQCNVNGWTEIADVAAGWYHTVGLKTDGTVLAVGNNEDGQCDVRNWTDIWAVAAGENHTVGLKDNGTMVAAGSNKYGQCDINGWTDVVAIAAGLYHTVGLKADGTVVAVGYNDEGQCNVSRWTNIVAVAAGGYHTLGLKADGTVVAVGDNEYCQCNVSGWAGIRVPEKR